MLVSEQTRRQQGSRLVRGHARMQRGWRQEGLERCLLMDDMHVIRAARRGSTFMLSPYLLVKQWGRMPMQINSLRKQRAWLVLNILPTPSHGTAMYTRAGSDWPIVCPACRCDALSYDTWASHHFTAPPPQQQPATQTCRHKHHISLVDHIYGTDAKC